MSDVPPVPKPPTPIPATSIPAASVPPTFMPNEVMPINSLRGSALASETGVATGMAAATGTAVATETPGRPPADARAEAWEFAKFLFKFAILVLIIRSFGFSSFNIPSESMQPRLLIGDYLLVNKAAYGFSRYSLPFSLPIIPGRWLASTPDRGDVVVFKAPPNQTSDYIKRVVGLPGDRVQVIDGIVMVNGTAIARRQIADLVIPASANMVASSFGNPCFERVFEQRSSNGDLFCRYPRFEETMDNGRRYQVLDLMLGDADTTGVYQVPAGHLFLMGDNRDRSFDSRFPATENGGIGIVPQDNLVGEAWVTIFSTDGSARWYNPASWVSAARWDRIGEGF